jgi:NAD(P)H dehydrogenase (quinone)
MTKVLVLYYSTYGHIETMAYAVAEGARSTGATADVKRVQETVPESVAKASFFKLDQAAPIAAPADLPNYEAIVVGAPTRFGRMPSAMGSFWEKAGSLWLSGALHGKVGGAFTSSATQHGGNKTTLFSIIANLMHFGMVIVGFALQPCRANDARGNRRRRAIRGYDDRGRQRRASAEQARTRRRATPRRTHCQDRCEARGMNRRVSPSVVLLHQAAQLTIDPGAAGEPGH